MMKKSTKIIIGLVILIIILYFGIVFYIAYMDEGNRQAIQNNCNLKFDYNFSKAMEKIDDSYDSSLEQLKNISE